MEYQESSVAEALLQEIVKMGVEYIFLIPGAQITPLVKALYKMKSLKAVIATHELAAAFMAIGYARASGKMGVVMSTGAPGAAYMTGAGITAKADKVPVLFITGNIPEDHHGHGEFQDASPKGTNDSAIFKESIGESIICRHPKELSSIITAMVKSTARSRPLHVQIPVDIQIANIDIKMHQYMDDQNRFATLRITEGVPDIDFDKKRKTVILLGHLALGTIEGKRLTDFIRKNQIGVITDMKARGIIPESDRESLGHIGFNSDFRALEALSVDSPLLTDQIFAIGVTEALIKQYIDPSIKITRLMPGTLKAWTKAHADHPVKKRSVEFRKAWLEALSSVVPTKQTPVHYKDKVSYLEMFEVIDDVMPDDTVYCLDAGQLRRAGSMLLRAHTPRSIIQSDTLSPMGFGICAAIGAKFAIPKKPVISIVGDGSMRMHGAEMMTAVRYRLPIIFIVGDNRAYISLPKSQEIKAFSDLPKVDWLAFANSFGMKATYSQDRETFQGQLEKAKKSKRPTLLWLRVPGLLDDEFKQTTSLEYKNWLTALRSKL